MVESARRTRRWTAPPPSANTALIPCPRCGMRNLWQRRGEVWKGRCLACTHALIGDRRIRSLPFETYFPGLDLFLGMRGC